MEIGNLNLELYNISRTKNKFYKTIEKKGLTINHQIEGWKHTQSQKVKTSSATIKLQSSVWLFCLIKINSLKVTFIKSYPKKYYFVFEC